MGNPNLSVFVVLDGIVVSRHVDDALARLAIRRMARKNNRDASEYEIRKVTSWTRVPEVGDKVPW